MKIVQILIVM